MEQIILSGLTPAELFSRLESILDELINKLPENTSVGPKYLSRQEVSEILKISLPTLNDWSKRGVLKQYKIGNRVLYRKDEVESAIENTSNIKFKKIK